MISTRYILSIVSADFPPPGEGTYLLLAWEWVGLYSERQRDPSWFVRRWDGKQWERQRYTFDTGGYENFEPHAWAQLPTTRPQFQEP